jgi:hypothetical protein
VGSDLPPSVPAGTHDAEHLRLLGIFHYVYAGIQGLLGLFFLLYIGFGLLFLWNVFPASRGSAPLPPWFGWVFIGMGVVFSVWFEALAVMNVLAGRFCRARRHRVFLLVVAALDCLWVPFGTALGVFDFVVLTRQSVRRVFDVEGG